MDRLSAGFARSSRWPVLPAALLVLAGCQPATDGSMDGTDPAAETAAGSVEPGIPTLVIGGLDYAFEVPDSIPPGTVEIVFENRGEVPHELAIALLRRGTTVEEFGAVMESGGDPEEMMEGVVGILLADAGETALGRLTVDFESGRTYILGCMLTDTEDAPPHVALGMIRGVTID